MMLGWGHEWCSARVAVCCKSALAAVAAGIGLVTALPFLVGCISHGPHRTPVPRLPDGLDLAAAVLRDDSALVERYLKAGGDPNMTDGAGRTMLHWAARSDRAKIAEILLAHGADRERTDSAGWTPLMHAVDQVSADVCRVLEVKQDRAESLDETEAALVAILVRRSIQREGARSDQYQYYVTVDGKPPSAQCQFLLAGCKQLRSGVSVLPRDDSRACELRLSLVDFNGSDALVRVVVSRNDRTTGWIWMVRAKKRFGSWLPFTEEYPPFMDGPALQTFGLGHWD